MARDQSQEQLLEALFQSVKDYAILALDHQGRITFSNPGAEGIVGFTSKEILGEHISLLYTPQNIAWGKPEHVLKLAAQQGRCDDEGDYVRKGGEHFWASAIISAMRNAEGQPTGFSVVLRDLTERRRRDLELKDQLVRLRSIFTEAVDGIITINERGIMESVNPAAERTFGYSSDELIGRNVKLLMPNPYHDDHDGYLQNYFRTGEKKIIGIGREVLGRRRDGSVFPMDLAVSEVQLGERRLFTGFIRDITERKRAEQQVRDSESRHRAIFRSAVDGIVTIDERGVIESVNPATERLFGYTATELVGRNVLMLIPASEQGAHQDSLHHDLGSGIKNIIGGGHEVIGRRKDGTTFPFELAVSELYIGGKRMFTGLIHDLSDRKKAEQERDRLLASERAARADAERASKAKDEFLAALSHELRTPLTPALLTISLMERDRELPARIRPDIEVLRRNIEMEARLIDDLLDLTRVLNNKMSLEFSIVDVHEILQNAERTCRPDTGIEIIFDLSAAEHHVRADAARLQQVFWNIISNAHKFTPIGGHLTIYSHNPSAGRCEVEFTDTGRGIDPHLLPRIFNAFEQGDPQQARSFGGLGLGLAISKAIVDAHHGSLSAESAGKGAGATFRVQLATVPAGMIEQPTDAPAPPKADKPLRILLVEDHEPTLRIVARLLRDSGHEVVCVASVSTAKQKLDEQRFDLMISDLGLPDGDGYEVMQKANQRRIKGIALSGYGMAEDVEHSKNAGFSAHLIKPVDYHMLISAVNEACGEEDNCTDGAPSK